MLGFENRVLSMKVATPLKPKAWEIERKI